jgi:hypothetical protein
MGAERQVSRGGKKPAKAGKPKAEVQPSRQSSTRKRPEPLPARPKPRPKNPKPPEVLSPTAMMSRLMTIIRRRKYGITADELSALSGCPKPQLYGLVQRLKIQGRIKSLGHGVYGKV